MDLLYNPFIQSAIETKKMADVMKENLNPLVEEYRRVNSKRAYAYQGVRNVSFFRKFFIRTK